MNTVYAFPAGTYYVGDPCYCFNRDTWLLLGNQTDWFHKTPIGKLGKVPMLAFGTAYGDGEYPDNAGRRYPVDSGLIGLVPEALIDADYSDCGHLIVFDKPFDCEENGPGCMRFGNIIIDTSVYDDHQCYHIM